MIFLAPQFAPAYLDLSAIYAAEGQIERARTLRQGAEELLRNGAAFLESRR